MMLLALSVYCIILTVIPRFSNSNMQMKKLSHRFQPISIFCILYSSKLQSCYLGQIFLMLFFFNCGKSHII